ncbi:MAG: lysophospholipid acyltransferase family protein, partial [Candidatus Omnitrophica bacterium]|nr:lysophospholipid acyltransferase family protein [Candidatus Omnitrophota bacterium]
MKKNSIEDYLGFALVKFGGPVLRSLPLGFGLFLGRRLGDLLYALDPKHRCQAYVNIKKALGSELSPGELKKETRKFFRCFGQNIIEIFFIPLLNQRYIKEYITFEGRENITKAFAKGKGAIFLGMHAGSWELFNVIWADVGFTYNLLVADQKHPRLGRLLNTFRESKGCKLIQRQNQLKSIILALRNNEAVGMTVDQGGRSGELVKFFGHNASMATGAVKLALKYGSMIVPGYYVRVKGPNIKVIIEPPLEVTRTG